VISYYAIIATAEVIAVLVLSFWLLVRLEGGFEKTLMRFFPHYDIVNGGELYLRRFMVRKDAVKGNIFIHHILKSDSDRDPHGHPWAFDSFILAGGYVDEAYEVKWLKGKPTRAQADAEPFKQWPIIRDALPTRTRAKVFRFYRRPASHTHMLKLHPGKTAWTFVRTTGQEQPWGFASKFHWTFWRGYLNDFENDPG